MSHFLARLVDRARGTAPRVEPVIAPRFAPPGSLGAELLPEISTEIESPASEPRSVPPRAAAPALKKESPTRSANAVAAEEPAIEFAEEPLLVPQKQLPGEESLVVRQREAGREFQAEPPGRTRATPDRVAKVAKSKSRNGDVSRSTPRPLSSLDHELHFPNESHDGPPIVRVTIGRIDVRAGPAPGAPPRKPPPPRGATLTLDAYLKERKEGKR